MHGVERAVVVGVGDVSVDVAVLVRVDLDLVDAPVEVVVERGEVERVMALETLRPQTFRARLCL